VKRRLLVVPLAVALAAAAYFLLLRNTSVTAHLIPTRPTAMIGSGSDAVAVGSDGAILSWLPSPEEGSLPKLPLDTAPEGGRLQGPVLEQAKVLGAAPAALRPDLEGSYFGESGVDVKLTSGIELRFGSASQAHRKWRAAAAVLADPSVTTLDYVDLYAPSHPSVGGSGHTLPPVP
jgi:cell division septal protein FtsQ